MSEAVKLNKTKHHPKNKDAILRYKSLVGLEQNKQQLISNLQLILEDNALEEWENKHHPNKLPFLQNEFKRSPLILLSGDVGCGKTELASAVGSELSVVLDGKTVYALETPSDLRGSGRVGELSKRVTAAFNELSELRPNEIGLLILDEADDVASSREKDHQHHEDRAGVNALIKELDRLERSQQKVAVLFITNRSKAMDPAILRRAAVEIKFERPNKTALKAVFEQITTALGFKDDQKELLVKACLEKEIPFTFSDLYRKVLKQTIINCWQADQPFSFENLLQAIHSTNPSPKFIEQ